MDLAINENTIQYNSFHPSFLPHLVLSFKLASVCPLTLPFFIFPSFWSTYFPSFSSYLPCRLSILLQFLYFSFLPFLPFLHFLPFFPFLPFLRPSVYSGSETRQRDSSSICLLSIEMNGGRRVSHGICVGRQWT